MFKILFGIVLGVILVALAALLYLHFGNLPVAVADKPFPMEHQLVHAAMDARIDKEMVKNPPVQPDENNLVAGAQVYRDQCAVCHGYYGKQSAFGQHMYPDAPSLWEKHRNGNVVGVSDDPPGETYWKVANGIRTTGMPEFKQTLSETEMWQVSILLANADKPLPPAALYILRGNPSTLPASPAPTPTLTPTAPTPAPH
jgi:hypothetical protein